MPSIAKKYQSSADGTALALLFLAVATYAVLFSVTSIYVQDNFGISAYDAGLIDQPIWRMSRGLSPFGSIKGVNLFGDHTFFYSLFFVPLYAIYPSIYFLFIAQALFLGLAAIPLFQYARASTKSSFLALTIAISFLLSPALQNMNLENIHLEILSVFFVSSFLYCALCGRRKLALLFACAAMLGKEDIGLHIAGIGMLLSFNKKSRTLGAQCFLSGVLWYLFCSRVVMPIAQGIEITSTSQPLIYSYWFQELGNNIFHPFFYWNKLSDPRILIYLWDLLGPVAFLSLLAPEILVFALPGFVINCLTGNDYMMSIHWHYNYGTIMPIYFAAALGARRLMNVRGSRFWGIRALALAALLLSVSLWFNLHKSSLPVSHTLINIKRSLSETVSAEIKLRQRALALVPTDAKVTATHFFVTHLSHRPWIYMFPNPYRGALWNMWFKEDQEVPNPNEAVEYIVLDLGAFGPEEMPIATYLANSPMYEHLFDESKVIVLRRRAEPVLPTQGIPFFIVPAENLNIKQDFSRVKKLKEDTFSMFYFPLSAYRFRNLAGEEIESKDAWALQAEGYVNVVFRPEQNIKLVCSGICKLEIDGQDTALNAPLLPGVRHFRIKYIPQGHYELKLLIKDAAGEERTPVETEFLPALPF